VVCVVSLEEQRITPGSVPYEQCREIRTDGVGASSRKLDWIIIPASAAIVATVIIAVIIFIACIKSNHKSREAKVREKRYIPAQFRNALVSIIKRIQPAICTVEKLFTIMK
jgi:hypothetical protein